MDDLRTLEQRREERPDGPVDPMGSLGATRHVDERQHRVQAEAADRVVGRAAAQLGPEGVACHDDLAGGKVVAAVGERDGDATREAGADPVRQPRRRGLLVDDDRETQGRGRQDNRERDEAARGEHDARPEPSEEPPGARDAGGNADGEVDDVLPCPVAAELSGRDREVGDVALGRAPGLDAGPRADPGAPDRALAQEGGDGEAGARVATGPAPRDDDLNHHASFRAGARARARSGGRAARRSRARKPPTFARTRSSR